MSTRTQVPIQPVTQVYGLPPPSPRRSPLPSVAPATPNLPRPLQNLEQVTQPVQSTLGLPVITPSPDTVTIPSLIFKTPLTPMTSQNFPDYKTMLSEASIEQKLLNLGYTPVDKVVVREGNDEFSAKYIKVMTPTGQGALVELNEEGYVSPGATDLNVVEVKDASSIPYSHKIGTLESVGQEIRGVAFLCEDNVCVVTREEERVTPTETFYIATEKAGDRTAVLDDVPVAYPVVRFKEVVAEPKEVAKSIDKAASDLRKRAYQMAVDELKQVRGSIDELEKALADFDLVQKDAARRLGDSFKELDKYHAQYDKDIVIESNRDRYVRLMKNYHKRHQLLIDLLVTIDRVAMKKHRLAKLTMMINKKSEYLQEIFKGVERDLVE